MSSTAEQYGREMHAELRYWAAWLPGTIVRLGDCGTVDDFWFSRRTRLATYGIDFDPPEPDNRGHIVHQSKKGVSVSFQAAASASVAAAAAMPIPGLPSGAAGAGITFARKDGVVFAARDCVQSEIDDIDRLQRDLVQAYLERGFPANYVVVTGVVRASSATILVSRGKGASVTLAATADLTSLADIASADAGLSIVHSRGLATQYVAEGELTPLFKVMGFKRHWLSGMPKEELEDLGGEEPALQEAELQLTEADFGEYCRHQQELGG